MTIIFWDIPSTLGPWSPNTWKIRYILNMKKIPYRTEWVEYPDIAAHCLKLGIPDTPAKRFGSPYYTLPAIHDPTTGVYLSDSPRIAEYLERQYPDGPKIFPHNTLGLQIDFDRIINAELGELWDFVLPPIWHILNPPSQEYYRNTREKSYGKALEEIAPTGEEHVERWAKVETGFKRMAVWYAKIEGPFIMGNEPAFADFAVGGHLVWIHKAWGDDDEKWKAVTSWDSGVWQKLLDALKQYSSED